jgi:hypothetical protein
MAEMSTTAVRAGNKKSPVVDVGTFAQQIEKQANTLAEFGWDHEAGHLRKWAFELRGDSIKRDYSGGRLSKSEA